MGRVFFIGSLTNTLTVVYNVSRWTVTAERAVHILACSRSTDTREDNTLVYICVHHKKQSEVDRSITVIINVIRMTVICIPTQFFPSGS